ncbi:MAG: RdgB/HAM1 family non-canonical purine NTP pyrophosphatase [Sphaerochaetaceae bacterium]|jgi:XTP/dITP diphosphohydrolase|nr:RdgB/HAM1 family non-canonical purine NTP pyrophosphatase [Sphaerochaetaceae bacterium]HHU88287.1 RdgB/HAM1 family non-canonical purine NTP pyrophosphatase [Spirochaetales bacterium]
MELMLASHNHHKLGEISALLLGHSIILPQHRNLEFSFEENGSTFIANALDKAEALYNLCGVATLADDSGLVVDALNGEPGIFSARYGSSNGQLLPSDERNRLLLKNLEGVPKDQRTARFVCAMALVIAPYRKFVVQETIEGFIANQPFGEGGFGYDPIFIVGSTEMTMAQLSSVDKNRISHRGKAAQRIVALLHNIEQKEIFYVS